jgi:hypothetical protein
VQNARQVSTFAGEDIRDLPTTRNIRSILTLTPGLTPSGLGADCVGGVGVWCNNNIYNLGAHATPSQQRSSPADSLADDSLGQGRVMVDGPIINTGGAAPDHGDDRRLRRRTSRTPGSQRADLRALWASRNRRRVDSTSFRAPAAISSPATTS